MEKLKENIKKLCAAIIEKLKQLAKKIQEKTRDVGYLNLQQKMIEISNADKDFKSYKIPIIQYDRSIVVPVLDSNDIDEVIDALILVIQEYEASELDDQCVMNFNLERLRLGLNKECIQLQKILEYPDEHIAYITVQDFCSNKLISNILSSIEQAQRALKKWEYRSTSLLGIDKYDGSNPHNTRIDIFFNIINNDIIKSTNLLIRFLNTQLSSAVSGARKAISERKKVYSSDKNTEYKKINDNNPNRSEVQKTVAKQNQASMEQKRHPLNESYCDIYSSIMSI